MDAAAVGGRTPGAADPRLVADTVGVILAGGAARRMGGGDKTLSRVGEQSILQRIIGAVGPQCAALVLSANGDAQRFAAFGLPVAADDVAGCPGPMAGVLAGLDWAAANRPSAGWLLSVPGDTPFLPHDLVARLQAARRAADARLAYAESGERRHATVALWPVSARAELRQAFVENGVRRMSDFVDSLTGVPARWHIERIDPFTNVNAPRDLAAVEAMRAAHEAWPQGISLRT